MPSHYEARRKAVRARHPRQARRLHCPVSHGQLAVLGKTRTRSRSPMTRRSEDSAEESARDPISRTSSAETEARKAVPRKKEQDRPSWRLRGRPRPPPSTKPSPVPQPPPSSSCHEHGSRHPPHYAVLARHPSRSSKRGTSASASATGQYISLAPSTKTTPSRRPEEGRGISTARSTEVNPKHHKEKVNESIPTNLQISCPTGRTTA